jgi:DNA-binding PadR family transcriptional regulator
MRRRNDAELTTPDLVLLSLLAEQPMHGYQANAELERRQVRDWAAISRPQVYYSLDKLARAELIAPARDREGSGGPDRVVYRTTAKGKAALSRALEAEDWTTARERPPFLTWLALSWQAEPEVVEDQVRRRIAFLNPELEREERVLASVSAEVGHQFHEAVWMLTLTIEQFKTELQWLSRLRRELPKRAPARNPNVATVCVPKPRECAASNATRRTRLAAPGSQSRISRRSDETRS